MAIDFEAVINSYIDSELRMAEASMSTFKTRLGNNAARAFELGMAAYEAAAKIEVLTQCRGVLKNGGIEGLSLSAQAHMLETSMYGERSNPSARLLLTERVNVWASMLDRLGKRGST